MAEEKRFQAGDNPNDYTVSQVVAFLKSDDVTGDEYDRVVQAEREGQGRVGIINLSGTENTAAAGELGEKPDGTEAAGPNEAATGQFSPADHAKTVDDPEASGDAGLTADQYPDEAPASLGPDMPQSQPEEDAHAATVAALPELSKAERAAKPVDYTDGEIKRYTPEEALREASRKATEWKTQARASASVES